MTKAERTFYVYQYPIDNFNVWCIRVRCKGEKSAHSIIDIFPHFGVSSALPLIVEYKNLRELDVAEYASLGLIPIPTIYSGSDMRKMEIEFAPLPGKNSDGSRYITNFSSSLILSSGSEILNKTVISHNKRLNIRQWNPETWRFTRIRVFLESPDSDIYLPGFYLTAELSNQMYLAARYMYLGFPKHAWFALSRIHGVFRLNSDEIQLIKFMKDHMHNSLRYSFVEGQALLDYLMFLEARDFIRVPKTPVSDPESEEADVPIESDRLIVRISRAA